VQQHSGLLMAMGRQPAPVPGMTAVRRNPAVKPLRLLSRDFGSFTLSSRHGGQVAWRAVPDPTQRLVRLTGEPAPPEVGTGQVCWFQLNSYRARAWNRADARPGCRIPPDHMEGVALDRHIRRPEGPANLGTHARHISPRRPSANVITDRVRGGQRAGPGRADFNPKVGAPWPRHY
jgi:hypothetical protein